jgi:hypothetical protein
MPRQNRNSFARNNRFVRSGVFRVIHPGIGSLGKSRVVRLQLAVARPVGGRRRRSPLWRRGRLRSPQCCKPFRSNAELVWDSRRPIRTGTRKLRNLRLWKPLPDNRWRYDRKNNACSSKSQRVWNGDSAILLVVTSYMDPINLITNLNSVYNHSNSWKYCDMTPEGGNSGATGGVHWYAKAR